jgi:hypothetical protein
MEDHIIKIFKEWQVFCQANLIRTLVPFGRITFSGRRRKKDEKFPPAALDSGYTRKYISRAVNKVIPRDFKR